jgi:acyl carrier protein
LRVDPTSLELASSPETVKGWDSFTQINLILAIETAFGIHFPTATVARIRTIADLVDAVAAQAVNAR